MKVEPPLDAATFAHASQVIEDARRTGRSPAEALHASRLLLTPARRRGIRADGVTFVLEELRRWRPAEFLRRSNNTPADLYAQILKWLEAHVSVMREKQ